MRPRPPVRDDAPMIRPLLYLHIAAGSVVLASMFVPVVTPKGGTLHRRAGWVFVVSMALVSISAIVLSVVRLMWDPDGTMSALFLGYLGILTGSQTSIGVRAIRTRSRTAGSRNAWDVGLAVTLLAGGVALLGYGLRAGQPLLWSFALVGLVTAAGNLWYWLTAPSRMRWWFEHMNAMLGGCIGGTTAFLVQVAARIADDTLLVWLAPTIVGVPATAIWNAYYRRKFGIRRTAAAPAAAVATLER